MKKLIAIMALATASGFAMADAITTEYGGVNVNNGQAHQVGVGVAYRKDINEKFSADVAVASLKTESNDAATTRTELGATVRPITFGQFAVYDRVALGNQFGSWRGANTAFNYWSNELGVATRVGAVDGRVGYRLRDAMDDGRSFRTHTTRANVGYNFTKNDRVGLGYDAIRGDYKANQWGVSYTRSF